jgi:hypothetical protein
VAVPRKLLVAVGAAVAGVGVEIVAPVGLGVAEDAGDTRFDGFELLGEPTAEPPLPPDMTTCGPVVLSVVVLKVKSMTRRTIVPTVVAITRFTAACPS